MLSRRSRLDCRKSATRVRPIVVLPAKCEPRIDEMRQSRPLRPILRGKHMAKASLRGVASMLFVATALSVAATGAHAQAKHYKIAYDQPVGTGYGIAATIFADKLK